MPHYMLIFFRRPSESLFAEFAAVRVVLGVYGDDVAFEAGRVRRAVLAVLALVDLFAAVSLHVLFELQLQPEAAFAFFALEGQVFRVDRQDVAAQDERVGGLEVAVAAVMDLLALVRLAVFLEFGGAVEAFVAHVALVGELLGVDGNDVAFQVAGVGALVVAVGALVGFMALKELSVLQQVLLVAERLGALFALER